MAKSLHLVALTGWVAVFDVNGEDTGAPIELVHMVEQDGRQGLQHFCTMPDGKYGIAETHPGFRGIRYMPPEVMAMQALGNNGSGIVVAGRGDVPGVN